MEQTEYKSLLEKYRKQECTTEELLTLWNWLSDEKNETSAKEFLLLDLHQFKADQLVIDQPEFQRIYTSIESKIQISQRNQKKVPIRISIIHYMRVAAMILMIFSVGAALSYWYFQGPNTGKQTFCEVKAPLGARSEIILPDGSHVWLNAGSKIKYLSAFNKTDRDIFLEGEAYFKVAKNKKIPFIVRSGDLNIIAIGTEFNVKAYIDEGIIETTLVEGKVAVKNSDAENPNSQVVYLTPNQKAVYISKKLSVVSALKTFKDYNPEITDPEKGLVYIKPKVDTRPVISWKENRLIVQGEEMRSLAIKLERKYNVTILFATENLKDFRFTGTLEDETLTQVLDLIKLTAPIDYTLDGKNVKIYENQKMKERFFQHLKRK